MRSITAIIIFCLLTYFFQPYMIPLFVLAIFLRNYLKIYLSDQSKDNIDLNQVDQNLYDDNEDDEDDKVRE